MVAAHRLIGRLQMRWLMGGELLHCVLYGRDITAEAGSMWCTEMGMEAGS
jgi:hypothetical protein